MKSINVDDELGNKIIKAFKLTLKRDCNITFDEPKDNYKEITTIKTKTDSFKLCKIIHIENYAKLKPFYYRLLSKKTKKEYTDLTDPYLHDIFFESKFLNIISRIFGNFCEYSSSIDYFYVIDFNSVIITLDKEEYEKLLYYTKYSYKIKNLTALNEILDINEKYKILFDDEIQDKNDLHSNFYLSFKDILPPNEN